MSHLCTPVIVTVTCAQVMIVIIVIFLVCQTPAFVNQLVYVIGVADSCGQPYYYYYHASNVAVSANSAVNFVVYCVFRRLFRRRLAEFCRCRPPSPAAAVAIEVAPSTRVTFRLP